MKTSTALLIFSIYGIIVGTMLLFHAAGSLHDYGTPNVDAYHVAILQYLGIADIGLGMMGVIIRNSPDANAIKGYWYVGSFVTLGAVLKGAYDIAALGMTASDFFYVDMAIRGVVGLACLYFGFKPIRK